MDDLLSVSNTLFMKACVTYDESRGGFHTHLHRVLTSNLCRYVGKVDIVPSLPETDEGGGTGLDHLPDTTGNSCPRRALMFKETLANLSEEAREVAMIILNGPAEILGLVGNEPPKAIRGAIKNHLRDQGWDWPSIWQAFKELKEVVR